MESKNSEYNELTIDIDESSLELSDNDRDVSYEDESSLDIEVEHDSSSTTNQETHQEPVSTVNKESPNSKKNKGSGKGLFSKMEKGQKIFLASAGGVLITAATAGIYIFTQGSLSGQTGLGQPSVNQFSEFESPVHPLTPAEVAPPASTPAPGSASASLVEPLEQNGVKPLSLGDDSNKVSGEESKLDFTDNKGGAGDVLNTVEPAPPVKAIEPVVEPVIVESKVSEETLENLRLNKIQLRNIDQVLARSNQINQSINKLTSLINKESSDTSKFQGVINELNSKLENIENENKRLASENRSLVLENKLTSKALVDSFKKINNLSARKPESKGKEPKVKSSVKQQVSKFKLKGMGENIAVFEDLSGESLSVLVGSKLGNESVLSIDVKSGLVKTDNHTYRID